MLKKVFISIILVAATFTASAQYLSGGFGGVDPVPGKSTVVKYAVKAGVNFTTVSGTSSADFSMAPGFQIGAGLNLRWGYRSEFSRPGTGKFGFQPEIRYSNQSVSVGEDEKLTMNRVSLPLMFRIYPATTFYFELGPDFSYLFSTSPDILSVGSDSYGVGECSGLATDVALGAGWESKAGFLAGVRYGLGVTALAKNLPWRTQNVSLVIGWMF